MQQTQGFQLGHLGCREAVFRLSDERRQPAALLFVELIPDLEAFRPGLRLPADAAQSGLQIVRVRSGEHLRHGDQKPRVTPGEFVAEIRLMIC